MLRARYDFKKALPSSCSFLASIGVLRFLLKPGNGDLIGFNTFITNHTNILRLVGGHPRNVLPEHYGEMVFPIQTFFKLRSLCKARENIAPKIKNQLAWVVLSNPKPSCHAVPCPLAEQWQANGGPTVLREI